MNGKTASLSVGIPLAFLLGSLAGPSPDATRGQGTAVVPDLSRVVGVVDLDEVRKNYPRASEMEQKWREEGIGVQQQLKAGVEAINKLKLELDTWEPFTPEWMEAQVNLVRSEAALKGSRDLEQRRFLIQKLEIKEVLHQDINRAVNELAKRKKLQLVLRIVPQVHKNQPLDSRVAMWEARSVLNYTDKLDLTGDVIDFLKSADSASNGSSKSENDK